jgi:hypothetical protein
MLLGLKNEIAEICTPWQGFEPRTPRLRRCALAAGFLMACGSYQLAHLLIKVRIPNDYAMSNSGVYRAENTCLADSKGCRDLCQWSKTQVRGGAKSVSPNRSTTSVTFSSSPSWEIYTLILARPVRLDRLSSVRCRYSGLQTSSHDISWSP